MADFWDKIKNFFSDRNDREKEKKQEPLISDEDRAREKELNDRLERADAEYRKKEREKIDWIADLMPQDSGYQYRDYQGDSLEDILSSVQSSVEEKKKKEQADLQNAYDRKNEKQAQEKDKTQNALRERLEKIFEEGEREKKISGEKLLDRGMGRSSIVSSAERAIENETRDSGARAQSAARQAVERLEAEIARLEKERDEALGDLDVSYARQAQVKLDQAKADYDKQMQQISQYNEKIDAQKIDYAKKREEAIEKQQKEYEQRLRQQELFEAEHGYVGDKKAEYDNRLHEALEFYRSLPKETARSMIESNDKLRTYLGRNYNRLLSQVYA